MRGEGAFATITEADGVQRDVRQMRRATLWHSSSALKGFRLLKRAAGPPKQRQPARGSGAVAAEAASACGSALKRRQPAEAAAARCRSVRVLKQRPRAEAAAAR